MKARLRGHFQSLRLWCAQETDHKLRRFSRAMSGGSGVFAEVDEGRELRVEFVEEIGVHEFVVVADVQRDDALAGEGLGKPQPEPVEVRFSMTKMMSAQPMWPSVTTMRASGCVPAERTS